MGENQSSRASMGSRTHKEETSRATEARILEKMNCSGRIPLTLGRDVPLD
jgi:hypothetical protein